MILMCGFEGTSIYGLVAQLVRAPPCHGGGRGFEPHPGRLINGILAQLGEHLPYKQRVTGSSPVGPILFYNADVAQLAEQLICNQQVIGSIPIVGFMDGFPSGQRGQTVNLLRNASVVRIHLHPLKISVVISSLIVYNNNIINTAGWSSLEARRAHNPKVIGSNPVPATNKLIFV